MKITSSQSSGGLSIPVLTITNFSNESTDKTSILCIGRLHPGESQGSWVMDGFITQLLSSESEHLLDRTIFKIIPMVNVDGVVLGNFRTGIMGRDLNRCFHLKDTYN
jgi:murein tripeptide amidase MpaA